MVSQKHKNGSKCKMSPDYFAKYPQQMRVSSERATLLYCRQPGYYGIHYEHPDPVVPDAILQLNEGAIAVFQGEPDEGMTALGSLSPIYALQSEGSLAVPTGLVFIRFQERVEVKSRSSAIQQAGYAIAQTPSYAPHAAWLRARSGKILDGLVGIPQLEAIPDVENVEPQMLMASVKR
jgi:hypothetical protein